MKLFHQFTLEWLHFTQNPNMFMAKHFSQKKHKQLVAKHLLNKNPRATVQHVQPAKSPKKQQKTPVPQHPKPKNRKKKLYPPPPKKKKRPSKKFPFSSPNPLNRRTPHLRGADPSLSEQAVLMRSLRDTNVAKIEGDDLRIFMALLGDLFPGWDWAGGVGELEDWGVGLLESKYF